MRPFLFSAAEQYLCKVTDIAEVSAVQFLPLRRGRLGGG